MGHTHVPGLSFFSCLTSPFSQSSLCTTILSRPHQQGRTDGRARLNISSAAACGRQGPSAFVCHPSRRLGPPCKTPLCRAEPQPFRARISWGLRCCCAGATPNDRVIGNTLKITSLAHSPVGSDHPGLRPPKWLGVGGKNQGGWRTTLSPRPPWGPPAGGLTRLPSYRRRCLLPAPAPRAARAAARRPPAPAPPSGRTAPGWS